MLKPFPLITVTEITVNKNFKQNLAKSLVSEF